MNLEKAIQIANVMYSDKKSSWGEPFIFHVMRVAMKFKTETEQIVSILQFLHKDMSESPLLRFATLGQLLRFEKFSDEIVEAIECIASFENGEHEQNNAKIKGNSLVKSVMIFTLEDLLANEDKESLVYKEYEVMYMDLTEDVQEKLTNRLTELSSADIAPLYTSEHEFKGFMDSYSTYLGVNLNIDQETIVREALARKCTLIDGEAGTGLIQTLHAIKKGAEIFAPQGKMIVISGASHSEFSYLSKRLQVHVETADSFSINEVAMADIVVVHDVNQMEIEKVDEISSGVHSNARIILAGDFSQRPVENGINISKIGIVPSFKLQVKMRANDSSSTPLNNSVLSQDVSHNLGEEEREEVEVQVPFLETLKEINAEDIFNLPDAKEAMEIYEQSRGLTLSLDQRKAILGIFENRVLVLTGETGSGLTENVKAIVECLKLVKSQAEIRLVTGRDHKQGYLSKRTGVPQSDIDSMPSTYADLLIVEEPGLMDPVSLEDLLNETFFSSDYDIRTRLLVVGSPSMQKIRSNSLDVDEIAKSGQVPAVQLQIHNH